MVSEEVAFVKNRPLPKSFKHPAIRRDGFLAHSGFDEAYSRPAIEDIELGGRRMMMDKHLRVKHLKKWTFWIEAYRGRS